MQNDHFAVTFHVPGTLAANVTPVFAFPFDVQLEQVQAVASNASNATISAGYVGAATAYMTAKDVGDSSAPAAFDRDDFVGGEYIHIAKDTPILITVDYDGASGTAAQNLTVLLIFSEG